jgi:hypothetical protein
MAARRCRQSPVTSNGGDTMNSLSATARVLILYFICLIVGQAIAVGIGLLLDPYSKTVALATFIPLYYGMYWVAWRAALFIGDRSPVVQTGSAGGDRGSGAKIATWLLAPSVLALDLCD